LAQSCTPAPDFIHYTAFFSLAQSEGTGKLLQFYFISISAKGCACVQQAAGQKKRRLSHFQENLPL